jgi:23S rRNA pseudouridine1911/1915/1917 synthase
MVGGSQKMNKFNPLQVIYEDNHILVVNKPVGMLSQSDGSNDEDMLSLGKRFLKKKYRKPGNVFLGLVHRLDRNVGGVMVFARTSKSASRLSEQIRTRTFRKSYYCILTNEPITKEARIDHYIEKDATRKRAMVYLNPKRNSKKASLIYRIVQRNQHRCLVEVDLLTGRYHQIRAQFFENWLPPSK